MGTICESQKADVMAEGELQGCRGLPGNGGSASLLQSSRKSSVCLASKAGQGVQQRKGLYLPMAVVQVHQDIQSLKHSPHGVDGDQRPVSLQGPITQPAQVAAGCRGGTLSRGVEWVGGPEGSHPHSSSPLPSLPQTAFPPSRHRPLSLDIRGEKGQELDTVHAPGHPHVFEVRAVTGPRRPGGRGGKGEPGCWGVEIPDACHPFRTTADAQPYPQLPGLLSQVR